MKIFDDDGIVQTTIEYDEPEDRFIIGSHQNIAPIMDDLSERNNDGTGGFSKSRDFRHMASIPAALYDEWSREAIIQGIPVYHRAVRDAFLKRKLAEHGKLRINGKSSGRVGWPASTNGASG